MESGGGFLPSNTQLTYFLEISPRESNITGNYFDTFEAFLKNLSYFLNMNVNQLAAKIKLTTLF